MPDAPIHRDTDARICGATTTVTGNADVYANNLLVSVDADPNTDGDGALIAHSNEVYADNILTVNHTPDTANADALCPVAPHCNPDTDQGSPDVCTGDPSKAPTVVIAPVVLAKIEAQVRVHIAVVPPPIQPTMTIDQEQQMEIELDDTPDLEDTPGEVIARVEDQVWSDICHPHDGVLNQHLLESSNDLWDEKGMKLKYHSAINNQHVFKSPNGNPDVNRTYQNEKILHVWDEIGFRNSEVWYTDQTAWCMGYVCYVLKLAGYQWFQTATALHADTERDKFGFVEIPYSNWENAVCGDVCLWKFITKSGKTAHHVNFLYTNKSQKMSFVGGNQSDEARNNNNPSGGAVTHSWRGTAPSIYNNEGTEGGVGAYNYITRGHDTNLIKIFKPKKIS